MRSRVAPLARRHLWILLAGVVPLLGALLALTSYEYVRERSRLLAELRSGVVLAAENLDQTLEAGTDFTLRMRGWMEAALREPGFDPGLDFRDLLAAVDTLPTGLFDDRRQLAERAGLGNLWLISKFADRPPERWREVEASLGLFLLQRLEHERSPQYRWSYYDSVTGDFTTAYPWVDSATILNASGFADLDAMAAADRTSLSRYELVGPEGNPDHGRVWTHAYPDFLGAGPMVSCLAPVYSDGQLVGSVGTDILLSYLSDVLRRSQPMVGRVLLINREGQLLGDSQEPVGGGTEIARADAILPAAVAALQPPERDDRTFRVDRYHAVSVRLREAPWHLVYFVADSELEPRFLNAVSAYLLLALLLTAVLLATWFSLHRRFALPALRLARFIETSANEQETPVPELPQDWRELAEMVHRAYAERGEYLLRLEQGTAQLEQRVRARTAELEAANRELDAFAHTVSHDLRAPLRRMRGFSRALLEDYGSALDDEGRDYLSRIGAAAQRMTGLVDDLLQLSRVTRREMDLQEVDLSHLARPILEELAASDPERNVWVEVHTGLTCVGDPGLLRIAIENLLHNAWKFTAGVQTARIEVGRERHPRGSAFYVRDNGAGFDPANADGLFAPFKRLHSDEIYEGTGIGLATVQRIIQRHGGKVWAEGRVGAGATFYFTLSEATEHPA